MIQYPMYFEASTQSSSGLATPFQAQAENYPPITCAIPKEFKGPGGGYSPEELYMLALGTCLIATFKVFAERAKLSYADISVKTKLTIDRDEKGVPQLKKVDCTFMLSGVEDVEKAKTLLGESQKYCLVSNAIKSEKTFNYEFG